ncbi:hypothetical protein WN944_016019 [Citrus x changshan-huyou]|uniref:Uncharacterized protein n=1 Tax=Citrus x changshan-huyou TaxID=2935761 RepID=A0AAP0MF10_9ROSI
MIKIIIDSSPAGNSIITPKTTALNSQSIIYLLSSLPPTQNRQKRSAQVRALSYSPSSLAQILQNYFYLSFDICLSYFIFFLNFIWLLIKALLSS